MASTNFEELKALVLSSLEANGVLKDIRAQLRESVYKALDSQEEGAGQVKLKPAAGFATEIIAEFFEHHGLRHSLSVFQTEAQLRKARRPRNELAAEIGIDRGMPPERSVLEQLINGAAVSSSGSVAADGGHADAVQDSGPGAGAGLLGAGAPESPGGGGGTAAVMSGGLVRTSQGSRGRDAPLGGPHGRLPPLGDTLAGGSARLSPPPGTESELQARLSGGPGLLGPLGSSGSAASLSGSGSDASLTHGAPLPPISPSLGPSLSPQHSAEGRSQTSASSPGGLLKAGSGRSMVGESKRGGKAGGYLEPLEASGSEQQQERHGNTSGDATSEVASRRSSEDVGGSMNAAKVSVASMGLSGSGPSPSVSSDDEDLREVAEDVLGSSNSDDSIHIGGLANSASDSASLSHDRRSRDNGLSRLSGDPCEQSMASAFDSTIGTDKSVDSMELEKCDHYESVALR
eukprot:gnl/TRDRNA2_/TRDRNA2_196104_c0_seq1.p1 gnl/TRDRNA2_/TRDRNA2_196104_c0~~gnl/TRDRNA2_/TRDRNA2_196104_c0_seq1.p1  ORF type:complete len:460 (+),score=85.46 gnl/TRDRNA2_/TRDRNA2_196104_c0_seq1:68-1447(+)